MCLDVLAFLGVFAWCFSQGEDRVSTSNMTTRAKKSGNSKEKPEHNISEGDSSGEEQTKETGNNALEFSEKQMETVSLLVRSAVSAAVAQVLPLARTQMGSSSHNASGQASPPSFSAQGDSSKVNNEHLEDGEVEDEQLDEYEKALMTLLGDNKVTGPAISNKVGRLLERCLGAPLDDKVLKEKRDAYPRPENIANLKVPRTNSLIFNKATVGHQNLDRGMQLTQSYLVGGIVAVGRQAEKLLGLRKWAASLDEREKESLPEEIGNLTGIYVELMDSLILFVRAMGDMTNTRRKMFRGDLLEPYKSLMEEGQNPPSPDWLAGEDVHAAICKAKANAFAAEDLTRRNKWPKQSFNRNRGGFRPYDNPKRQNNRQGNNNSFGGASKQGRKSEGNKQHGESFHNRQDFRRRDSR